MYNITSHVLIKAEMKGWISKRRDMSIKHTPSPMKQSLPELRLELPHLQTERQGKTSGKTGQKWEKGREKWWLQFHARVQKRHDKYRVALHPEYQTKC